MDVGAGYNAVAAARSRVELSLLRVLNNGAKWVAIARAARMAPEHGALTVVELACGKGNDFWKWRRAAARRAFAWHGVDASSASIAACRAQCDHPCMTATVGDALTAPMPSASVVSMQMAFHYFGERGRMRALLERVSAALVTGGVFVFTYFDMESFARDVDTSGPLSLLQGSVAIARRGADAYSFTMDGHVPDVGEYVVHWDELVRACGAAGLQVAASDWLNDCLRAPDERVRRAASRAIDDMAAVAQLPLCEIVRETMLLHRNYRVVYAVKERPTPRAA